MVFQILSTIITRQEKDMSEQQIFESPASTKAKAWIDNATYLKMYQESVDDPQAFWDK